MPPAAKNAEALLHELLQEHRTAKKGAAGRQLSAPQETACKTQKGWKHPLRNTGN